MSRYKFHGHGPDQEGSSSAGLSVANQPSSEETTPLLLGKTQRAISRDGCKLITYGLLALFALLFVSVNLYLHFFNCPLYPGTIVAIRREWENDVAQHDLVREQWQLEKQEHGVIEEKWKLQAEWHERDVARRIREEDERQERARHEWTREFERHAREVEEYEETVVHRAREEQDRQERVRKEWDQEVQEHKKEISGRMQEEEERQERIREAWAQEAEKHRHECKKMERRENQRRENERQKWRREVEDHDQIEEERRKREEEERQKLDMFWGDIKAHTCATYATREYTAQLMNLPATWEHRVEACKATPLEVHGISYLPKSCEDRGPGLVIGRWEINRHEPDCAANWIWYKDQGCTSPGSGKRRIEHYLDNLPKGSDWREFCATTPARFHGMEFSGAQECFQQNSGAYGHWQIDDASCQ